MKKLLLNPIPACLPGIILAACVPAGAAAPVSPVFIDQTGYPTYADKTFLVSTAGLRGDEAFAVIDAVTGATVFSGRLSGGVLDDVRLSGMKLFRGDFSPLRTAGSYRVKIAGRLSPSFRIDDAVYRPVAADALRSLSLIRANTAVNDPVTGLHHPAGHKEDASLNGRDYAGGWYNAGDYGKWTDRDGTVPASTDAGDICGVMGLAARVFQKIDPAFSKLCRSAADRTWDWLKDNPNNPQTDPYYPDTDPRQEVFWAAAEMYVLTGGREGKTQIGSSSVLDNVSPVVWNSPELFGVLALLLNDATDSNLRRRLQASLLAAADRLTEQSRQQAFGHASDGFWWSSNFYMLGAGQLLAAAHLLTGVRAYREAALEQLHYILGRNALSLSFVCGHGERTVQHPYHWAYFVYGVALPGWVSGGANPHPEGADPLSRALQQKGTPPALCFVDECRADGSWASNEGTLAMTSALVFLAGMF